MAVGLLMCGYLILLSESVDGGRDIDTKLGRRVGNKRTLGPRINGASQLYSEFLSRVGGVAWWRASTSGIGQDRELRRLVTQSGSILNMRSVRAAIRPSAALVAMLYTTVSVYAGGQGGYGGLNVDPNGFSGGVGDSATGVGGAGGIGLNNNNAAAAGGAVGRIIASPTTINADVTGGAGVRSADQNTFGGNGGGGGGTGVVTSSEVTNDAVVIGGKGGGGASGAPSGAAGGGGGGAGVVTSTDFTNSSTVTGGAGGDGIRSDNSQNSGGGGGGAGVYVVGNGALVTITNNGTITGGAGGRNSAANSGGAGGAGEGGG